MSQSSPLLELLTGIGLEDLSSFNRAAFLAAGLSPARVTELHLVHAAYYGTTATPETVTAAVESGVCIDMLAQIERCIRHIASDSARARYRLALIDAAATTATTCASLARYAKTIVPAKEAKPVKGAHFGLSRNGLRTAIITADEHVMADLEASLRGSINRDKPAAPQMAAAFEDLMRSGAGVPAAAPRPLVLVPAPELARVIAGDGDDVVLGLSDGTTMSGADFVNRFLAGPAYGIEAALFHPTEGPLNHYRDKRFASEKQRTLAKATQPICASPDCRRPADHCEIHHAQAWKNGGLTNMDNLTVLCEYHNRVNDDDDHIRKRGRIEIRGGRHVWVSPTGYPRTNTRHPFGAMHTLFGHWRKRPATATR